MGIRSLIHINGLKGLDKSTAFEFVNFKGTSLSLNGLTSLDNDVLEELVFYEGTIFARDVAHKQIHSMKEVMKKEAEKLFAKNNKTAGGEGGKQ